MMYEYNYKNMERGKNVSAFTYLDCETVTQKQKKILSPTMVLLGLAWSKNQTRFR